jgi:uncharacterized protein
MRSRSEPLSEIFVPFIYALRARKVRVGTQEAIALAAALALGLHQSSLDGFYYVARALLIHREGDLDAFEQVYAAHFCGAADIAVTLLAELQEWLKHAATRTDLTEAEFAALQALNANQLKDLFEARLREQKERHDGGNRWIGTGGTSPFGANGAHPTGLRVSPQGGQRSALGVADPRRFRPYRSDVVLDVRQIDVALRKLRAFSRQGVDVELDLDATIAKTSSNGGELEVVLRPLRKSNVRVLLLMDVGGSMDPHAHLVSQLFSAAKRASSLRSLKTYYFHNCVYGHVFETERFTEPVRITDLLRECGPEWKLVMVGDAAMHPGELLGRGDWSHYAAGGASAGEAGGARSGLAWMQQLSEHFRRAAWLNPDPPNYWGAGTADALRKVFSMYPLTLDGLGEAISALSRSEATLR